MEAIAKIAAEKDYVDSANIWNEKRVYVNLAGKDMGYNGDRNLKIWYSEATGWVAQGFKGIMTSAMTESLEKFEADFDVTRR